MDIKNEIDYCYAEYSNVNNDYFKNKGFTFIEDLTHPDYSILYMTLSQIIDTIEMLCWKINNPYDTDDVRDNIFYENCQLLYQLLRVRVYVIINTTNNEDLLDGPDQYVTTFRHGEEMSDDEDEEIDTVEKDKKNHFNSVSIRFIQEIGAYMDQIEIDLREEVPNLQILQVEIPNEYIKKIYKQYFKLYDFSYIIERFSDFKAEQVITQTDRYVNELQFSMPTKLSEDVLVLKNDIIYKRIDDKTILKDIIKTQAFLDFMFYSIYEEKYNKPIKYERYRILNLYKYNNTLYMNIAEMIHHNFSFEKPKLINEETDYNDGLPYIHPNGIAPN
jgi:hypothetical protein